MLLQYSTTQLPGCSSPTEVCSSKAVLLGASEFTPGTETASHSSMPSFFPDKTPCNSSGVSQLQATTQ